jgi:heme/copper-type cytochrome/quinol oxidase subunit 2
MMLNKYWIALIVIVVIGHFIWFVLYAIKTLKDDRKDQKIKD